MELRSTVLPALLGIFIISVFSSILLSTLQRPIPPSGLLVTLDENTYHQGDSITVTLRNMSNETLCFNNTVYDLVVERFQSICWEVYDSVPGDDVTTCLEPERPSYVTWQLGRYGNRPFPPGYYRVGTYDAYAEFAVP